MSIKSTQYHIAVLPLDGYAALSLAACTEPFRAANLILGYEFYHLHGLSVDGMMVKSSGLSGFCAKEQYQYSNAPTDMVLLVAGGDPAAISDPTLFAWLRQRAAQRIALAGVSGGPLILAKAGVMRGYRMTIHWEHAALLDEMRPNLLLERSLYVIDRDRYTCAGGTAPLDMMVALISRHHGASIALQVSDWFMHTAIRAGSDPQRSGLAQRIGTNNSTILQAVDAMENHVADPLSLAQIAALSNSSSRQLNRLFKKHFNTSVMEYYRQHRLHIAQELLRQSGLSVAEIGIATGFASASHFCARFADAFQITPQNYRHRIHIESSIE